MKKFSIKTKISVGVSLISAISCLVSCCVSYYCYTTNMEKYYNDQAYEIATLSSAIVALVAILLLIVLFLKFITKAVIQPIEAMKIISDEFAETKDLQSESLMKIKTGDEIEVLAKSTYDMQREVINHIEEIEREAMEKARITAELDTVRKIQELMFQLPETHKKEMGIKTSRASDIVDFCQEMMENADVENAVQIKVAIALDELCMNIFSYSEATTCSVFVHAFDNKVIITLKDNGNPYNPLDNLDPDTTLSASEMEIEGLVVYIAKNVSSEITYDYGNEHNILSLTIKK